MATTEEINEAVSDAKLALLKMIKKEATQAGGSGSAARACAEAYAWLTSPGQPHGGGTTRPT